jgi:hypothetical protein
MLCNKRLRSYSYCWSYSESLGVTPGVIARAIWVKLSVVFIHGQSSCFDGFQEALHSIGEVTIGLRLKVAFFMSTSVLLTPCIHSSGNISDRHLGSDSCVATCQTQYYRFYEVRFLVVRFQYPSRQYQLCFLPFCADRVKKVFSIRSLLPA